MAVKIRQAQNLREVERRNTDYVQTKKSDIGGIDLCRDYYAVRFVRNNLTLYEKLDQW